MKLKDFQTHIRNQYGETLNELINEMFLNAVDYCEAKDEDSTLNLVETIRHLMPFSTLEANLKFILEGFMADFYASTGRLGEAETIFNEGLTILNKYHSGVSELTYIKRETLKMELNLSDAEVKELKYHLNVNPETIDMFLNLKAKIEELKKENNIS